jgi:phosphoglucosamine mutase
MSVRLFGTDGIRGRAGVWPLDAATIEVVTEAVADRAAARLPGRPFLVARDTRASGPWIARLAAEALSRARVPMLDAGVLPTPAAAGLILEMNCCGGMMISASHNPADDNGLKFFTDRGFKLPDAEEAIVSLRVTERRTPANPAAGPPGPSDGAGDFQVAPDLLARYVAKLLSRCPLDGLPASTRVVVDCAHGASTPAVLALGDCVGFHLEAICAEPDGTNINRGCGATNPQWVAAVVSAAGADLGFALDGDGDRIAACDSAGRVLDGDALLYVFADFLRSRGQLPGSTVVGTVMTNLGLEAALARRGIRLERTPVGDRHIQARMLDGALALGGEPSGHLILQSPAMTGDGLLAGLFLLHVLAVTRRPLTDLLAGYRPFPSRIFNLRADRKPPLEKLAPVRALEAALAAAGGRTVIRYSGTEPLLRVMVEAEHLERVLSEVENLLGDLKGIVQAEAPSTR